jgi:hypothetical protein
MAIYHGDLHHQVPIRGRYIYFIPFKIFTIKNKLGEESDTTVWRKIELSKTTYVFHANRVEGETPLVGLRGAP